MEKGKYAARFDQVLPALSDPVQSVLDGTPADKRGEITEIRLRCGQPVICTTADGPLFFPLSGGVCRLPRAGLLHAGREDLLETFRRICEYSVHTHEGEMAQGFVTMRGGHRAGICGRAVVRGGRVESLQDISAINIRIAHEVKGAADGLLAALTAGGALCIPQEGLLLAGPPGSGKTTLLRDLTRQLSSGVLGAPLRITVVDERGEIGAVWDGVPQNDLGPCTDILTGCPKALGIEMAVRSMSPELVVFDELGTTEETEAVTRCLHAGAAAVTTIHADSLAGLCRRPQAMELLSSGAIGQVAFLSAPGQAPVLYSREDVYAEMDRLADIGRAGSRCGAVLLRPAAHAHRTA
ncbi:MAG: Flp pilus assembly complex ATPase component TadA [Clostridiales bacterium]|nr:Flp pilus assembly complex ATPase component TadA [Clostridiales bacterium]